MSGLPLRIAAGIFSLAAGFGTSVLAEQRPVVVELYTSQGCSSCPPADALFSQLQGRDDVIPIALHVDYWDYIGWKDEFGHPDHALRQRAYAAYAGRRSVYTPEMVVNGQTDIVGSKAMDLSDAISQHRAAPARMVLDVTRVAGGITLRGTALEQPEAQMDVYVLQVMDNRVTKITKGENRGKTYEYSNIAHSWQAAGTWDGRSALEMSVPVTGSDAVVVLVQETNGGAIVAAARVK